MRCAVSYSSSFSMACILLWSSAVMVRDSQAYRKMDVTRERISHILELRKIFLLIHNWFQPCQCCCCLCCPGEYLRLGPRSGELPTQKLKSHLVRTQSLNVLPFRPGVGQYIAIHATLTARDFFLAYFYPSSPFTCIFSKTSPIFFLCWPAE